MASGRSSVRFVYDPGGLIIEGQLTRGHPGVARTVTVVDPANFAASAFRTVLEEAGITVRGRVRTVNSPAESPIGAAVGHEGAGERRAPPRVLGTHLSPTLAEVVTVTNHVSQNLYAEAMFKTVGRTALGDGSFAGGARAVQYFLECEKPINLSNVRIVDGSGLSPLNRVTARATIHLLDLMRRSDAWETYHRSLPEAASPNGGAHSLRNRMGGTPAARNLRAKTGTISSVSGLSGYVTAGNGELLAFSIYGNELGSTAQFKRAEDAIGARLARFSRPSETDVEPTRLAAASPPAPADARDPAASASREQSSESPPARTHRVRSGETFDAIARQYGIPVRALQSANPEIQPRRLQIGQTIVIPAG